MRHPMLFVLSMLALCAIGCVVTPPKTPPIAPKDYYYRATPERVWNALLLIYTDLNIPISNMDKSSWFMRSQDMPSPNLWVDCGTDWHGVQIATKAYVAMNVTTLLRPSGDSTAMRLSIHVGEAVAASAAGNVLVQCVSRGVLEWKVTDEVRQRLGEPLPSSIR